MQFQLLNPSPHDAHFIPWDSVVLPLGTPRGACTRGSQQVPASRFGLCGHSLGAVPQPRLLSPSCLHCRHLQEKCRHVSVLLPQRGTALTLRGNFSMKVLASQTEAASARSYGAGQITEIKYQLHMGRYNGPI
jgi:hypothetical protein